MSRPRPAAQVLLITGPIASGKTTLARAVGRAVEADRARCAVVDLDLVYEMLDVHDGHKGDDRRWDAARRGSAGLTGRFLDAGIDVVVVEGEFDAAARRVFAADLGASVTARFIELTVSYDEAYRRARADPTRGVSRDPAFLWPYYQQYERAAAEAEPVDLVLDTERLSIDRCVEAILGLAIEQNAAPHRRA